MLAGVLSQKMVQEVYMEFVSVCESNPQRLPWLTHALQNMFVPRRFAFQVALERLHSDAGALAHTECVHTAAAGSRSLASQLVKVYLATELISRDSDAIPGELVAIVEPTRAKLGQNLLDGGRVPDLGNQSARIIGVRCDAHVILEYVPRGPLVDGEHVDLDLDLLATRVVTRTSGVESEAIVRLQPCQ